MNLLDGKQAKAKILESLKEKTKIEIYPSINVFNINRMVESMIIAKIKKSNTLLVAIFMQTTLN